MPATRIDVLIVDDDAAIRDSLKTLLGASGWSVRTFESAKALLDFPSIGQAGCIVADVRMPDMDGLTLQQELIERRLGIPVIIVTGFADVALAVNAMKAGAVDFIEKPFDGEALLDTIDRALSKSEESRSSAAMAKKAESLIALLTNREKEVLAHLVAGRANKIIAYELGISPRTVEIHRANLMDKLNCRGLLELIRCAVAGGVEAAPGKPAKR